MQNQFILHNATIVSWFITRINSNSCYGSAHYSGDSCTWEWILLQGDDRTPEQAVHSLLWLIVCKQGILSHEADVFLFDCAASPPLAAPHVPHLWYFWPIFQTCAHQQCISVLHHNTPASIILQNGRPVPACTVHLDGELGVVLDLDVSSSLHFLWPKSCPFPSPGHSVVRVWHWVSCNDSEHWQEGSLLQALYCYYTSKLTLLCYELNLTKISCWL